MERSTSSTASDECVQPTVPAAPCSPSVELSGTGRSIGTLAPLTPGAGRGRLQRPHLGEPWLQHGDLSKPTAPRGGVDPQLRPQICPRALDLPAVPEPAALNAQLSAHPDLNHVVACRLGE